MMKKHIKNLGLVLGGVLIGVTLSFSDDISAATSKLLGGKVGKVMTVSLDDKNIGEAAVIGGTSYIPVRVTANELGLGVNVDGNEIELTSPESSETTEPEAPVTETPSTGDVTDVNSDKITAQKDEINQKIGQLKFEISEAEDIVSSKDTILRRIESDQEYLKKMEESKARGSDFYSDELIASTKAGIERYQKNLTDAETNLPVLKEKLADLESQLASLK